MKDRPRPKIKGDIYVADLLRWAVEYQSSNYAAYLWSFASVHEKRNLQRLHILMRDHHGRMVGDRGAQITFNGQHYDVGLIRDTPNRGWVAIKPATSSTTTDVPYAVRDCGQGYTDASGWCQACLAYHIRLPHFFRFGTERRLP